MGGTDSRVRGGVESRLGGTGNQCNLSRTSDIHVPLLCMYVYVCTIIIHTTFAVDWVTATNKAERGRTTTITIAKSNNYNNMRSINILYNILYIYFFCIHRTFWAEINTNILFNQRTKISLRLLCLQRGKDISFIINRTSWEIFTKLLMCFGLMRFKLILHRWSYFF